MKRGKLEKVDMIVSFTRQRSIQILLIIGVLYLLLVSLEIPLVFRAGSSVVSQDSLSRPSPLESEEDLEEREAPSRPLENISRNSLQPTPSRLNQFNKIISGLALETEAFESRSEDAISEFYRSAKIASEVGKKFWDELESGKSQHLEKKKAEKGSNSSCPHSISLSGNDFLAHGGVMMLPCGLTLGSHITLVGKPRVAQPESDPQITMVKNGEESVMVSQFIMELQGLNTVEGEDPPRILHFNPRLKGDWSGKPVIELNTCYRMQWGSAHRCEGWKSKANEDTVDGQVKCEKWIRDDEGNSERSKATWWLNRLIGRTKRMDIDWPYPFAEDKLFVLTLSAGFEGYHVNVDGKHIVSFPYRTGFALEDATGLSVIGDIDVQSVLAASLPQSHPSFAPQQHLEMSRRWQAPPLPDGEIDLFIGILSAGNHFAERMAVRKSWMRHKLIRSSKIVARFFVALHARKEVNVELKKEAEFFGDIVIVPYMDNYDLVVLKTVAICEHGVHAVSAKYIMKCDDDTFVKVDSIMNEIKSVSGTGSVYIGNINYYHKPLRYGKWAVTYEEWPEEDYPPYANGPGYIVSSDIAQFVISNFERRKLRLFKMEDVSMGMWVEQFNSSKAVKYVHSFKYCQFGDDMSFNFGKKKKGKGADKPAPTPAAEADNNDDDDDDNDNDDGDDDNDAAAVDDDDLDEDAAAASAFMGEDEDDDDTGASGTEQKKSTARDGPVPWAGTTRDYAYDELVDRIFNIISADRPDLAGGARKKYQMKPPKVERDGTKKTLWINFPEMCKAMHRLPDHVWSYVFAELGTTGSVDGTGRLVIKGRFQPKQIEKVVRHYIAEYVSCRTCRSPNTRLVKENRLQFIACETCNSRRTVAAVRKGFEAQVGKRKKTRLAAEAAQQKPGK